MLNNKCEMQTMHTVYIGETIITNERYTSANHMLCELVYSTVENNDTEILFMCYL